MLDPFDITACIDYVELSYDSNHVIWPSNEEICGDTINLIALRCGRQALGRYDCRLRLRGSWYEV